MTKCNLCKKEIGLFEAQDVFNGEYYCIDCLEKVKKSKVEPKDPEMIVVPDVKLPEMTEADYLDELGTLRVTVWLSMFFSLIVFVSIFVISFVYISPWATFALGILPVLALLTPSPKDEDLGLKVTKEHQPHLFQLIEETAKSVGAEKPREVWLSPLASIHVPRGSKKIIIGIGCLRVLTKGEFKAILAHEMGHFSSHDTVFGYWMWRLSDALTSSHLALEHLAVELPRRFISLYTLALTALLVVLGIALRVYSWVFDLGFYFYSRQIEKRADLTSRMVAGEADFRNGLTNYVIYSRMFNQTLGNEIFQAGRRGKALKNAYEVGEDMYINYVNQKATRLRMMTKDESVLFNTHPNLRERIIGAELEPRKKIGNPAINLISGHEKIEEELTVALTEFIHKDALEQMVQLMVDDAVKRQGKCKYCGEQFKDIREFLDHELKHETDPESLKKEEAKTETKKEGGGVLQKAGNFMNSDVSELLSKKKK